VGSSPTQSISFIVVQLRYCFEFNLDNCRATYQKVSIRWVASTHPKAVWQHGRQEVAIASVSSTRI